MLQDKIESSLGEAKAFLGEAIICWEDAESDARMGRPRDLVINHIEGAKIRLLFAQGHLRQARRLVNGEIEQHSTFDELGFGGTAIPELLNVLELLGKSINELRGLDYGDYAAGPPDLESCGIVRMCIEEKLRILQGITLTERER